MFCKSFTFHLFENLLFRLPNMSSMFDAPVSAAYQQYAEYLYFAAAPSSPYGYVPYEIYIGVCDYINVLTENLNELGAKHYATCEELFTLRAENESLRASQKAFEAERADLVEKHALCVDRAIEMVDGLIQGKTDLRAENEALRAENEALRADLKEKTSCFSLATREEEASAAPAPVAVEAPAPAPVVNPIPVIETKPTTGQEFIDPAVLDFMAGKKIEPKTTVSSTPLLAKKGKKGKKGNAAKAADVPEVSEAQMAAAQAYFAREYADIAAGLGFGESVVERAQRLLLEAERLKEEERRKEAKANHDANLRALEKAKAAAEEAEAKKTATASVVTPVETALPEVNRYASIIADVLAKYANEGACATAPVSETSSNRGCEFESMDAYNTFIDSELSNPLKTRRCGHGIHENMETCRFRHVCTIFKKVGNKSVCACILKNRCIFGHRICSSIKKANCSAPDCPDWHTDDQTRVTIKGM
jgi:regulator of replication initiation timing